MLHEHLPSYESIVRLGGDEFVCTISDTTIEIARERLDEITAQLSLTPDAGSITVGFAELAQGDLVMDLIDRPTADGSGPRETSHDRRGGT